MEDQVPIKYPMASVLIKPGYTFILYQEHTFVLEGTDVKNADEVDISIDHDLVQWVPSKIPRSGITVSPDGDDYFVSSTPVLKPMVGGALPRGVHVGDSALTITVNPPPPPPGPGGKAHGTDPAPVVLTLANTRYVFGSY